MSRTDRQPHPSGPVKLPDYPGSPVPDLENLHYRVARRRRRRKACTSAVVAVAVVGCGSVVGIRWAADNDPRSTVLSQPASPTETATAPRAVPAGDAPDSSRCTGDTEEGLAAAAESIALAGEKALKQYSGLRLCPAQNQVTVYRIPGDADFDRDLRAIATRNGASLTVVDSKYSRAELSEVQNEILGSRRDEFKRRGAVATGVSLVPEGYAEVGVEGDPDGARSAFADYGDRVRIVKATPGGPL